MLEKVKMKKESEKQTVVMSDIIAEVKPLVENKLNITFGVRLVSGHVCLCKPLFKQVILGDEFILSVCDAHDIGLYTAIVLILTHEGLHITGLKHDAKGRKMGFYSHTLKDRYTPDIAAEILQ